MINRTVSLFFALLPILVLVGCDDDDEDRVDGDTISVERNVEVEPVSYDYPEPQTTITLPVLDVFLADTAFLNSARTELQLTDAEIDSLRRLSSTSVTEMYSRYQGDSLSRSPYSTRRAGEEGIRRIGEILGADRGNRLVEMVRMRWNSGVGEQLMAGARGDTAGGADSQSDSLGRTARSAENPAAIPSDTRIVINIPAYRMDLFNGGRLVGSWEVAIGYPEFPLPTGVRRARQVIFNPTWTPPTESWVTSSGSVTAGKTIPGGDPKNPLGIIKIPIGLPSLIHAGKSQSVIGSFGSHGCVGLTDAQMKEFVKLLGEATGTTINDSLISYYGKNRTTTKSIALGSGIPVELRYETIGVVDGGLVIYRDVYDYNTNTEENLRQVLRTYGVDMASLDQATANRLTEGLRSMAIDAQGESDSEDTTGGDTAASVREDVEITRSLSGKRKVEIAVPSLRSQGYPAMMNPGSGSAGTASSGGGKGDTSRAG